MCSRSTGTRRATDSKSSPSVSSQRIGEHGNRDCRFSLRDSTRRSTSGRHRVLSWRRGPKRTSTGFIASTTDGGNHGAFDHHRDIRISDSLVLLSYEHVRSIGRRVPRDKTVSSGGHHLVPGGNDSARRLAVGVFGPRLHCMTSRRGINVIAIYVPTRKLSVYQSGVTSGGTIVVFETIPFKEIRAIWRFKSVREKGRSKRSKGFTPASSRTRSVQASRTLRA